jgi:hypothetical protein
MELEPVQAAEELKILKFFVAFDFPKVRCHTNYYAELLQAFYVSQKVYGSYLGVETPQPNEGFLWFSSAPTIL